MKLKDITHILYFLCLVCVTPVYAQKQLQEGDVDVQAKTFDFNFNGGTLTDLTESIARADIKVNILLNTEAEKITIPKFRLRSITERDLYDILRSLGDSPSPEQRYILSRAGDSDNKASNPIWIFKSIPEMDFKAAGPKKATAEPISVGQLLQNGKGEGYTIEQITTAIQRTVEAFYSAKGEEPQSAISFQYHKDTKLLIVSGEQQAVALAHRTIEEMWRGIPNKQDR